MAGFSRYPNLVVTLSNLLLEPEMGAAWMLQWCKLAEQAQRGDGLAAAWAECSSPTSLMVVLRHTKGLVGGVDVRSLLDDGTDLVMGISPVNNPEAFEYHRADYQHVVLLTDWIKRKVPKVSWSDLHP